MKSSFKLLITTFLLIGFILAFPVFAQEGNVGGSSVTLNNPVGSSTITELLHKITTGLVTIATPIVGIMVLVGAFQMLFAAGDPEKFKRGKKTILYTVIGYAIILLATGVTSIIKSVLN
jgi:hypothetical protein